jgi:SNF2 family DNA or RNA helicase
VIVSEKHRKLVVRSRHPERIKAVLPHAKEAQFKGRDVLVLPHTLDDVKVLNNLGLRAPSPILYYYGWPRNQSVSNPFDAQRITAAFLTLWNRAFVLNGLGTGKTLASLWAYDYLRSIGAANKLLVISPLSTVDLTWGDSIFEHFTHLDFAVLHGARKKRFDLLNQDFDVYITNHDGAKILADAFAERKDISHVIIDEISQCARNAQTDRWKALNKIVNKQCNGIRACWGMTATPTPNAPTDAWAQARLLTPENVPKYHTRFRDMVMRQSGPYLWVPRKNSTEIVHKALNPSIRFSREECVDLPPTTYQDRTVSLTTEQKKMYKDMESKLRIQIENGEVTAVNEAVKALKLVQIACGVVYDAQGEKYIVDNDYRLKEVLSIVQESQTKSIVFVPFVSAVNHVAEYLENKGFKTGVIHGGVSSKNRHEIFLGFQSGSSVDVLVAQPRAMSHGLTLTAASTIVWFAPVTSSETYEQANGRVTRPGQRHNTLIVNVAGTKLEEKMFKRLKAKQKMQNLLLDMVEQAVS